MAAVGETVRRPVGVPPGVAALVAVLSVALLGPALRAGYVLRGDEVFVPDQVLLPWMVGAEGGLPRAVPQDAVVAALTGPVPGWIWEKAALLAALLLLGTGTARLVRGAGRGGMVVAAAVAVWSGYVSERLLLGHWSLVLAVGALPWALAAADRARDGSRGASATWLLWCGLASLTPSGGLLVVGASLPVLLSRGAAPVRGRAVAALLAGVLQLPWLIPALQHGAAQSAASGAEVFAARAEGPWGVLLTVLTTGGAWNADAVPTSRTTWWSVAVGALVLAVAVVGARGVQRAAGRPVVMSLLVWSLLGVGWACLGAWSATAPAAAWIVESIPGAGLLRDAQKWTAPWLLLLSLCAGTGAAAAAAALRGRTGDRLAARAVVVGVVLLPVIGMPDLAYGISGRLAAVEYPDGLDGVRTALDAEPPGGAISLPWQPYRAFGWNDGGRPSLDPVPRAMTRTVLFSSDLVVRRGDRLVVVTGDDPAAAEVSRTIAAGRPLAPVLARLGVAYAVVAADVPDAAAALPQGSRLVTTGDSFSLFALPLPPEPVPQPSVLGPVVGMAGALAVVLGAASVAIGAVAAARRRT